MAHEPGWRSAVSELAPTLPHMSSIRVLVVDDHEMFAQGLSEVLGGQTDIEVIGRAGTVRDARRKAGQFGPDVVVMDYRLPDGDGLAATRDIRAENPDVSVVMVTASDHDTVVAAAVEAGCSAYVSKDRAAEDVVTAVRTAARGEMGFPAAVLGALMGSRAPAAAGRSHALTPRELEVLQLLAEGHSTREVAEHFVLSVSTVRNHIHNLLTKLGARSKLEAVTMATRQGIIDYPR